MSTPTVVTPPPIPGPPIPGAPGPVPMPPAGPPAPRGGAPAQRDPSLPSRSSRHRPRRRSAEPPTLWRSVSGVAGVTMFVLAAWAVLYVLVFSNIQHDRAQHKLYATYRAQLAQALAPLGGVIAPGSAVAVMSIPDAGLTNEVIVEGTTSGDLEAGPGHLRNTPLPGQPGISVIFGRSVSFGGPFKHIAALQPGDNITVTTGQGTFSYQVDDVRHPGQLIPSPPKTGSRLTLVTSEGSGWRAGWSPSQTVYVDATLQGKTQPNPGGGLSSTSSSEKVMATETDAVTLMQVVLWLQLLAVVVCLIAWVQTRWARGQVWLVGLPIVLAVLWGLSTTAVRLLPNLM